MKLFFQIPEPSFLSPSFYLFLIQCSKLARSAIYTVGDILLILAEDLLIFFETTFSSSSSFSFGLFEPETISPSSSFSLFDDDCDSADNNFLEFFGPQRGGNKFMNKYTARDIRNIIKKSAIGQRLEKVGFADWYVELDLTDSFNHYLYIRSKRYTEKDQYIGFLIVRIDQRLRLKISSHSAKSIQFIENNIDISSLDLLNIQWLSLQNPGALFSSKRPRLPGQKFPGSGIGRAVFIVIRRLCIINHRDGIMNVPEHFHNAVFYEGFTFLDPVNQGYFEKMKYDLTDDIQKNGLASVSWAIGIGALRLGGEPFKWNPGEQIFPLSRKTFTYFNSHDFTEIVDNVIKTCPKFEIDWESTVLLTNQKKL
ncbi:hypothetical protein M9Y10_045981 [Tritrichomonas musculus]|uniref:Initiator binding domain-containing protein n=1 Tax=Tritrichomonas musculus TaxID=1915356 RepID=A0ABR2JWT0_9EUKA